MSGVDEDRIELTIPQAAEHSGVPASTVRRWAVSGYIEARKLGRDWLVRQDSLDAMPRTIRREVADRSARMRLGLRALLVRLRVDPQGRYVAKAEVIGALEDILNG